VRVDAERPVAARENRTRVGGIGGSSSDSGSGSDSGNDSGTSGTSNTSSTGSTSTSTSRTSDPGLAGGGASASPPPAPCWNVSALGPLEKLVVRSRKKWNATEYGALDSSLVSMDLCHRAITNLGDHSLLRSLASKLASGRCTQVVVLAGSIACGEDDGMRWPYPLKTVLDATWPCGDPEGHVIHNLCESGTSSSQGFQQLQRMANQALLARSDLIIVDKSVNDVVAGPKVSRTWNLRDQTRLTVAFWTEAIVRRALTLFPHIGILYVETSWSMLWCDKESRPVPAEQFPAPGAPFYRDSAADHLRVLAYYDVPQLELLRALGPLRGPTSLSGARGAFLAWMFLQKDCNVHHSAIGARITVSVLVERIAMAVRQLRRTGRLAQWLPWPDALRVPERTVVLTPGDMAFVMAEPVDSLSFLEPGTLSAVAHNDGGWVFATDLASKPNTLMTSTPGACVAVLLDRTPQPLSLVWVGMLASYQGFATAEAQVLAERDCGMLARAQQQRHQQTQQELLQLLQHDELGSTSSQLAGFLGSEPWDVFSGNFTELVAGSFNCRWEERSSQMREFMLHLPGGEWGGARKGCAKLLRLCNKVVEASNTKLKLGTILPFAFEAKR
jgi:hypothetical protein